MFNIVERAWEWIKENLRDFKEAVIDSYNSDGKLRNRKGQYIN